MIKIDRVNLHFNNSLELSLPIKLKARKLMMDFIL